MKDINRNLQGAVDGALEVTDTQGLIARTALMLEIQRYVKSQGWSLEEAAIALRETKPRLQNLMNGESAQFTVEQLINVLARAGLRVRIEVLQQNDDLFPL